MDNTEVKPATTNPSESDQTVESSTEINPATNQVVLDCPADQGHASHSCF